MIDETDAIRVVRRKTPVKNAFIYTSIQNILLCYRGHAAGGAVVEALRYKPEGHGFDLRKCYWNFSLT
jgi:hypothetical protein